MARRLRIGHPRQVRLLADADSYAVEGISADFEKSTPQRLVDADAGSFSVTGVAAALNKTTASGAPYTLTAARGTFAVTGRDASLYPVSVSDWGARSTKPGVVWAHNFDTDAEVNAFRFTGGYGNDPTSVHPNSANVRRITTDHPDGSGGVLEINIPAGGQASSNWWRPLSAIAAGNNGKATADPGAGGTLSRRAWTATDPSMYEKFSTGYYGHPSMQTAYPAWPAPGITSNITAYGGAQSGIWDGNEFYLQFRVKMTSGRTNPANPSGKLLFLSNTYRSNPANEIVLRSNANTIFDLYTSNGNYPNSFLTDPQGATDALDEKQPGYNAATCTAYSAAFGGNQTGCFYFTPDQWCTVLIRLKPGTPGNPGWNTYPVTNDNLSPALASQLGGSNANTSIEVWVAPQGQAHYTKIWSKPDYVFAYGVDGNPHPPAFNAIIASAFMNGDGTAGADAVTGFQQRYSQFIFSRDFIPAPTTLPSWLPAVGQVGAISLNSISAVNPCPANGCSYSAVEGQSAVLEDWNGGAFAPAYSQYGGLVVHGGGHNGYFGNEVYVFNCTTRLWERINNPTPTPGGIAYSWDTTEGELVANTPASTHTYYQVQYLPPERGGGTKGSFILLVHTSNHQVGGGFTGRSHRCDLATGVWSRFSTNRATPNSGSGNEGSTCYDSLRDKFWYSGQATSQWWTLDSNRAWAGTGVSPPNFNLYFSSLAYDQKGDIIIAWDAAAGTKLTGFDAAGNGAYQALNYTGTAPSDLGPTSQRAIQLEYVPETDAFYSWNYAYGALVIYKLKPPTGTKAQRLAGTWTWSTQTFTLAAGSAAIPNAGNGVGAFSRFRYAPALRSFVVWSAYTGAVYAFRHPDMA